MDHAEAVRTKAVERYILQEFSIADREEFEEHYFSCTDCAMDLRTTAGFLDAVRSVFQSEAIPNILPIGRERRMRWLRPQYAVAASVVFLALVLYQNLVTIPRLRSPQALEFFSLTNLGSRGRPPLAITPPRNKPFVVLVDIPPRDNVSAYRCDIVSEHGNKLFSVDVPAATAQHTVPLFLPASRLEPGKYDLVILARQAGQPSAYDELDRRTFEIR